MEIKICGITQEYEIDKLIEEKVEYAGFVLNYPKSKRNNSIENAKKLLSYINDKKSNIKTVAVTVSPTLSEAKQIEELGFDILQIHNEMSREILEQTNIPIFRAYNMNDNGIDDVSIDICQYDKIIGILIDAKSPGSGESFDWNKIKGIDRKNKKFILAGGLNKDNIRKGILMTNPDIVDCSSGVEFDDKNVVGKDINKIKEFVEEVRR